MSAGARNGSPWRFLMGGATAVVMLAFMLAIYRSAKVNIRTQREEIAEMDWLLRDIEKNGPATAQSKAQRGPVLQVIVSP